MTRGAHRCPEQLHPDSLEDMWHAPLSGLPRGGTRHSQASCPDDNISNPDILSGSLTVVSKPCRVIPDSLLQLTFRRLQSERTGAMTSRLPRSLTVVCRVMMTLSPPRVIMTSQKVFPSLKREAELLTLYKGTFTYGGR